MLPPAASRPARVPEPDSGRARPLRRAVTQMRHRTRTSMSATDSSGCAAMEHIVADLSCVRGSVVGARSQWGAASWLRKETAEIARRNHASQSCRLARSFRVVCECKMSDECAMSAVNWVCVCSELCLKPSNRGADGPSSLIWLTLVRALAILLDDLTPLVLTGCVACLSLLCSQKRSATPAASSIHHCSHVVNQRRSGDF